MPPWAIKQNTTFGAGPGLAQLEMMENFSPLKISYARWNYQPTIPFYQESHPNPPSSLSSPFGRIFQELSGKVISGAQVKSRIEIFCPFPEGEGGGDNDTRRSNDELLWSPILKLFTTGEKTKVGMAEGG